MSRGRKQGSSKRRGEGFSSDDDGMDGSEEGFGDEDNEDGDALLRDSAALKGGRGGVLEPGYLNIVRRVCRVLRLRRQLNILAGKIYSERCRGLQEVPFVVDATLPLFAASNATLPG